MRVLMKCLRSRKFVLSIMRYCSVIFGGIALYTFGTLFSRLRVEMRLALVVSFLCIAYGYILMYYGVKFRRGSMMTWGYVMTALGIVVMELGTLFVGGF